MAPARRLAMPSPRSASRSSSKPPSDDNCPPSNEAVSFLRRTAGKSNEAGISSDMAGVALQGDQRQIASTTNCYANPTTCTMPANQSAPRSCIMRASRCRDRLRDCLDADHHRGGRPDPICHAGRDHRGKTCRRGNNDPNAAGDNGGKVASRSALLRPTESVAVRRHPAPRSRLQRLAARRSRSRRARRRSENFS